MLRTRLCDVLGIEAPVVAAPMGPAVSTPELVAAVSAAGGLGVLSFGADPPGRLRERVRRVRELTDRPFGVNFLLAAPFDVEEPFRVCLEERVPVLSFFWGDVAPYAGRAKAAGAKVIDQVGSAEAARRSAAAGADVVIAQGVEAGGHVAGTVTTLALVPRVVDAVAPVPVVAAGGIADARGLVAALALGAAGAAVGTRFLATPEADAHPLYKRRVLGATEEDTVRTTLFGGGWPDAPHRVLRTPFVERWLAEEDRGSDGRPDEPVVGEAAFAGGRVPVRRFAALPPDGGATGEVESMPLLAGQGVGLVADERPAAEVVRELVEGARRIIADRLGPLARG